MRCPRRQPSPRGRGGRRHTSPLPLLLPPAHLSHDPSMRGVALYHSKEAVMPHRQTSPSRFFGNLLVCRLFKSAWLAVYLQFPCAVSFVVLFTACFYSCSFYQKQASGRELKSETGTNCVLNCHVQMAKISLYVLTPPLACDFLAFIVQTTVRRCSLPLHLSHSKGKKRERERSQTAAQDTPKSGLCPAIDHQKKSPINTNHRRALLRPAYAPASADSRAWGCARSSL